MWDQKLLTAGQTGDKYWKRLPSLRAWRCFLHQAKDWESRPQSCWSLYTFHVYLQKSWTKHKRTELVAAEKQQYWGVSQSLSDVNEFPGATHHLSNQEERCPKGRKHVLQDIWYLLLSLQMGFNLRCIRSSDEKCSLCTWTWQEAAQQCRWRTPGDVLSAKRMPSLWGLSRKKGIPLVSRVKVLEMTVMEIGRLFWILPCSSRITLSPLPRMAHIQLSPVYKTNNSWK